MKKMDLSNLKVAIITHTFGTGPAQELENFLKGKVAILHYIGHPFSFARDTRSHYRLYEEGKLKREHYAINWKLPELAVYLKDTLYTLIWVLFVSPKLDLIIAADNLNAFTAWLLKKLGRTKKVIFYTIDYIPKRFENKLLNRFYHWVDSFCVKHCDQIWNLSSVMVREREKKGIPQKYRDKQFTVPIGTDLNVERLPFENIDRYSIAFVGHLREGQGVEFLISALPGIVEKVSQTKLLIIGTGPLEKHLKEYANDLGLTAHIEFAGFIKNHREVQNRLAKCAIGVAPYADDDKTYTRYTDPGKPKAYLAAGLPVVITKVPQIALEIDRAKAGIAIDYDKDQFVQAVTSLLTSNGLLQAYRKNARRLACKFAWNKIFQQALESTLYEHPNH